MGSLGKLAYDTYRDSLLGGNDLPEWENLGDELQETWALVAGVIWNKAADSYEYDRP